MAREFSRTVRVAENIKRALAPMLDAAVRDSGVEMATITEVDVSPDFASSRIFVSLYCDPGRRSAAIKALNARAGHLRHQLASSLHIKKIPMLRFQLDNSIERGIRITQLIDDTADGTHNGS